MPIIDGLLYPDPPEDASDLVRRAYTEGLARIAVGLTAEDMRMLRRGVRRGELWYGPDPTFHHQWHWLPVVEPITENIPTT